MPWKVFPVSDIRLAFVHQVRSLHSSVAEASRLFGISRKTGYKWLARHQLAPDSPLGDLSTRPRHSPRRTADDLERAVLKVRDEFGWGPRKIHAFLRATNKNLPSVRTIANILCRHQRVHPAPAASEATQRFQRAHANELWQCDFKGYLEINRQRVYPFTVLDDHSRFLFAVEPCLDQTMLSAWNALWHVFGEVGLPNELLCDHAFGDRNARVRTLSWFEARWSVWASAPVTADRTIRKRKARSNASTALWNGRFGHACVAITWITSPPMSHAGVPTSTTSCVLTRP